MKLLFFITILCCFFQVSAMDQDSILNHPDRIAMIQYTEKFATTYANSHGDLNPNTIAEKLMTSVALNEWDVTHHQLVNLFFSFNNHGLINLFYLYEISKGANALQELINKGSSNEEKKNSIQKILAPYEKMQKMKKLQERVAKNGGKREEPQSSHRTAMNENIEFETGRPKLTRTASASILLEKKEYLDTIRNTLRETSNMQESTQKEVEIPLTKKVTYK